MHFENKKNERLNPDESQKLLKAIKIQLLANEVFGGKDKALNWMNRKLVQFDNLSPVELIQYDAGTKIIQNKLLQMDSGFVF